MARPAANTAEDRQLIFEKIRSLLKTYSPPFGVANNAPNAFALAGKEAVVNGRMVEDNLFASVIVHPKRVSLYFMPVYTNPALAAEIPEEVEVLRTGKSCYNIRRLDDRLLASLKTALDLGLREYERNGWV